MSVKQIILVSDTHTIVRDNAGQWHRCWSAIQKMLVSDTGNGGQWHIYCWSAIQKKLVSDTNNGCSDTNNVGSDTNNVRMEKKTCSPNEQVRVLNSILQI